jgi:hypothetical protein
MSGADVTFVAYRELVAALGPAARQNVTAILGLHALAETMGLRPFPVIRLKSTFRHYKSLLNVRDYKLGVNAKLAGTPSGA